jgi:hypothetical protein
MSYPVETKCEYCKSSCIKIAANLSSSLVAIKSRKSFCSKECRTAYNFKQRKDLLKQCEICNNSFRLRSKSDVKKFCSSKCYYSHKKDNPELYNIAEFTKIGHQHSNTPESIQKGLKKKFDKGTIVDWKLNKDWKRFYKKCDALTRVIKVEMLKEWDGYDYYDGEYIKPYLELSVHHKNYPTLDHKYPRSKAFQDGLTPYEITVKENLVWTKRTNNSKKGNKTLNV